jgi:LPXTG-motif cell wall-anchored protein
VSIGGNTTLSGLSNGAHSVTAYAQDAAGNIGASETISFSVETTFSTTLVIASMASVAVIGLGLLVYFKKRKH